MKTNDFESRLQQTPLQPPPERWRQQILDAARTSAASGTNRDIRPGHEPSLLLALRTWLWPHPTAWGVMAAIWLVLGAVQVALHEPRPSAPPVRVTESGEAPTLLNLQNQWLLALHEPLDKPQPPPARALPPQSAVRQNRETVEA